MNKENLITLVGQIYRGLDTISVSGYNNIKVLSNCMEALQQLANDINDAEPNLQRTANKDNIKPVNPCKPRPEPSKEDGD